MPRLTTERREARRALIVAAARRCFSRNGFHRTSMPDVAAEAGLSTGAPYRYFASKEEIIVEIAGEAFGVLFEPVESLVRDGRAVTTADLVAVSLEQVSSGLDELLRCAVQTWAELLIHEELRKHAVEGVERVRARLAEAIRVGREAGTVAAEVDPDRAARVVIALLHGYVLQHTAFGWSDADGFAAEVRTMLP